MISIKKLSAKIIYLFHEILLKAFLSQKRFTVNQHLYRTFISFRLNFTVIYKILLLHNSLLKTIQVIFAK